MATTGKIEVGQRVWVAVEDGRRYGWIACLPQPFLDGAGGCIVLLDGKPTAVTCSDDGRGRQWDFAEDDEA